MFWCVMEQLLDLKIVKSLWNDNLKISCHIQAIERNIKLITQATEKVCEEENRDSFVGTTLPS